MQIRHLFGWDLTETLDLVTDLEFRSESWFKRSLKFGFKSGAIFNWWAGKFTITDSKKS